MCHKKEEEGVASHSCFHMGVFKRVQGITVTGSKDRP